ncbi:MAG: type I restriction enzyme HsdR N-terminal domain-containing protein [Patescibacteria group bacterium]|jgi:hypothetical protein
MFTSTQIKNFAVKLKTYKKRYLKKLYEDLDESATRIMVNSLLTDVLGYTELEEIKTEYRIRGEYADYIIQVGRQKHFVVEVKSIQLDINEKHLRQSINYAANEGIDWIILTNGKQIELYRVLFSKPIESRKVFGFDADNQEDFLKMPEFLIYLTKRSVQKGELENFWKRFEALEPNQLSKNLYDTHVIKFLKKVLKKKTGLSFGEDDILESVYRIISTKIETTKPKLPTNIFKSKVSNQAIASLDKLDPSVIQN